MLVYSLVSWEVALGFKPGGNLRQFCVCVSLRRGADQEDTAQLCLLVWRSGRWFHWPVLWLFEGLVAWLGDWLVG